MYVGIVIARLAYSSWMKAVRPSLSGVAGVVIYIYQALLYFGIVAVGSATSATHGGERGIPVSGNGGEA